jgi:two-component system, chemotaxis family, sensor kinase Cph1
LTNLLTNAIKFSRKGQLVKVSAHRVGGSVEVQVSDQGRGIPKEQLEQVFNRYVQAYREDMRSGTGLGLYIVKGIVDAHGGSVSAESSPGAGSTFRVRIRSAARPEISAVDPRHPDVNSTQLL